MNRSEYLIVKKGALSDMIGIVEELGSNKVKLFIHGKEFNFSPEDVRIPTFDEYFETFIKDQSLVEMSNQNGYVEQKFSNGWVISIERGKVSIIDPNHINVA